MCKNKLISLCLSLLMVFSIFTGCDTVGNQTEINQEVAANVEEDSIEIADAKVPLANTRTSVLVPEATGKVVYENKGVRLDASNSSQGYIMIKYSGSNSKIKIQITGNNNVTYTYNLNARNAYEVFPLSEGNGKYNVKVFENISGTKYSQAFNQDITVKLANPYLPFLYPNQYVHFSASNIVVKKAFEITKSEDVDLKKVEAIYNFTVNGLTYDKEKAAKVQSGYLPNIDLVYQAKKGICFDYAAIMTSMLRSQNIPCKLIVGYTGDVYHAWINVYTPESGWVDGMIFFDGEKWQLMDPTFASSGKKNEAIMKYIGNGSNYKAKYSY